MRLVLLNQLLFASSTEALGYSVKMSSHNGFQQMCFFSHPHDTDKAQISEWEFIFSNAVKKKKKVLHKLYLKSGITMDIIYLVILKMTEQKLKKIYKIIK